MKATFGGNNHIDPMPMTNKFPHQIRVYPRSERSETRLRVRNKIFISILSGFSPDNFVYYSCITLNQLHHLCRYISIHIIRNRDTIITIPIHFHSSIYSLKQRDFINPRKNKTSLIQSFGTFGTCANTNSRKRVTDRSEKELSSGNVPLSLTTA